MNDCIFSKYTECRALTNKNCNKCSFYKSRNNYHLTKNGHAEKLPYKITKHIKKEG